MRRLIHVLCCMAALVCSGTSLSYAGSLGESIRGNIVTADKQPAVAVSVLLKEANRVALSDDNGNFIFNKVKAGDYTLEISLIGHAAVTRKVTVHENQATVVAITLEKTSQQLSEFIVTSGATRFAKKKSDQVARMQLSNLENAQVYTVLPKELLQEQLVTDFRGALQTAPGVTNVTQGVGSGGIGLSIRMRGFSGTNAGGAIRNGMATNWMSMSDPVNLESIEVIKGPSGTLFGGVMISYGGLVNRVTKKPFDEYRGEVGYTTGSFGFNRLTADVNTPLNKEKTVLMRLNAALEKSGSFLDYGRSSTMAFAPAFTFKLNDRLTVDLDVEMFRTKRNTTYIGRIADTVKARSFDQLSFDFQRSYTSNNLQSEANILNAFAKATYKISDTWTSTTSYSYANTENNANYLFLLVNSDTTMQRQLMNIPSSFGVNQLQQNFNGDFKIGGMRNRLLVGLDYTQVTSNDRRTVIPVFDVVKINQDAADISIEKYQQQLADKKRTPYNRNYQTYSAYAADVLNLTPSLMVMLSGRIDHYNSKFDKFSQTAFSPKAGIVYQVLRDKVSLFTNYASGFSNPTPKLIYAEDEKEKTNLKPEISRQFEGGVKVELLSGKLSGTVSYYDIEVQNMTREDREHPNYYLQDATQRSSGIETDLIANPFRGMHMIFGYGYNNSRYTKADSTVQGLRAPSAPQHVANWWISYKLQHGIAKGLGFGFGGNYQSESFFINNRVKSKEKGGYNTEAVTFMAPSFVRLDATIFYDQPRYRIGVKVNNLANREYWTTDAWATREPTRQLVVNMSYKF
ncbi:TonB-dependent receptor [Chitinophaga sp. Mgbs1]|uniref:TonB-dependent receptor n=1 Tax=Chitinophaga solisilvae TaxID=1233460 RepID=A0A9Q5GS22_9BACT|nr:TonB-dependent receptor [Chitinophaga solisilvae]